MRRPAVSSGQPDAFCLDGGLACEAEVAWARRLVAVRPTGCPRARVQEKASPGTIAAVRALYALLLIAFLAGCASAPTRTSPPPAPLRPVSASAADKAATQAAAMIGKPYRYGSASPSRGFDCSGLVQYGYARAGVKLPHNTERQRAISRRVRLSEVRRGDLLFFDEEGKKSSHVGIYLGRGMFVHAPSSGKTVRSDRVESPYWKKHLSEVRRLGT